MIAVDAVAMREELRIERRAQRRVFDRVAPSQPLGHRAVLFGQRLEEHGKGRPVEIEGAQSVADQKTPASLACVRSCAESVRRISATRAGARTEAASP